MILPTADETFVQYSNFTFVAHVQKTYLQHFIPFLKIVIMYVYMYFFGKMLHLKQMNMFSNYTNLSLDQKHVENNLAMSLNKYYNILVTDGSLADEKFLQMEFWEILVLCTSSKLLLTA